MAFLGQSDREFAAAPAFPAPPIQCVVCLGERGKGLYFVLGLSGSCSHKFRFSNKRFTRLTFITQLVQEGRRKKAGGRRKESLYSKLFKLFQLDSYFRHAALGRLINELTIL
jgi:hypothetical protein